MSLFDRLFGRRSVDKIIEGLQDDEWMNVEVPDTPWHRVHDLPLHIHQIPPMGEEKPDGVNVMVTTYADADIYGVVNGKITLIRTIQGKTLPAQPEHVEWPEK